MPYYDVSIPLKLKRLTYYYERDEDLTGFAVTVPLKDKFYEGIVINKREDKPEKVEKIKKIETLWGRAYSKIFIEFLSWMSFYYIAEIGSILRLTFFEEIISYFKGKKKRTKKEDERNNSTKDDFLKDISTNKETLTKIIEALRQREYKSFLIHCPNVLYEMKLMIEVANEASFLDSPILLIFSEIREVKIIYQILKDKFGDSVVMLHSEMKTSECHSTVEKIMEDRAKIIVGTRFAIFSPVKKLSLIMLSQESSWLYKAEETPRYNVRDAAIMRGFLEGCPVILCDTMPSVNSYWNSIRGKFELIDDFDKIPHPEIRILKQPFYQIFHPEVLLHLKLNEKEGVLVITPRTGFSLLRCAECGEVMKCEKCGYGIIYHKDIRLLECNRCGIKERVPDTCPYCGGVEIHSIGTGIDRLREELKNIFPSKESIVRDYNSNSEEIQGIFILQAGKVKKSYTPQLKTAVFLDFDFFLSIPDYRAMENAFGKVLSLVHFIKHDGTVFIQTRNPENEVFKFIRSYDFKSFYINELKQRKETLFPPFVRLIKLTVKLKNTAPKNMSETVKGLLKSRLTTEVIGPFRAQKTEEIFFILRSKDKKRLTEELHLCLDALRKIRGISLKIEVDPVNLKI